MTPALTLAAARRSLNRRRAPAAARPTTASGTRDAETSVVSEFFCFIS